MTGLTKSEILRALERLATELQLDERCELLVVGGAALVLLYEARESTRDVDAVVLQPDAQRRKVHELAEALAEELGLPRDWLNDGAKGYLHGISQGEAVFESESLCARTPRLEQLLAMKLSAWRDDLDVSDARLLLARLAGGSDEVWALVEPFVVPGRELKARYAFDDIWEADRGDS